MKKEIAMKWAETLKSGEYKQGTGVIKKGNKFCCLGVLCDLASKEGIGKWDGNIFITGKNSDIFDAVVLPVKVTKWAGLKSTDPILDDIHSASTLNDSKVPFKIIADYLRINYKKIKG